MRGASTSFPDGFRTYVEIIGLVVGRPIRRAGRAEKAPRLSNTGGYGYLRYLAVTFGGLLQGRPTLARVVFFDQVWLSGTLLSSP